MPSYKKFANRRVAAVAALSGAVLIGAAACSSSNSDTGPTAVASGDISSNASPEATGGAGTGTDQQMKPPVPMNSPAAFGNGVTAKVVSSSRVDIKGSGPGEISGPGVKVEIQITNGTNDDIDLNAVTTNVFYGASRTPASPVLNSDSGFSGTLAAGKSATGTYYFSVPKGSNPIELQVSYSIQQPVVVFTGKIG